METRMNVSYCGVVSVPKYRRYHRESDLELSMSDHSLLWIQPMG